MVDALLALCVAAGYWAYARLLLDEAQTERRAPSSALVLAVYASATLAFLVKGPVGPAFVILPVLVHALVTRRWSLLLARVHLLAVPLFLAALACWPLLLRQRAGAAALSQWWEEGALGRFIADDDYKGGHTGEGAFYYLRSFPTLALPWSLALPFMIGWLWKRRPVDDDPWKAAVHRVCGFFAAACVLGLLLLSAASSKRSLYALPLLAPLAVLTAVWIASVVSRLHRGLERAAWVLFGASLVVLSLGGLFGDADRDFTPMARDLESMRALGNTVGFDSSETVRAIVPFRTGTILANLRDTNTLDALRSKRSGLNVLTEGPALPAALEPLASRLQRVRQWSFGRHEISLYALAPP
jgi:4-amino-4-deoxy-L-arabinose transferase-like glycosyltransferase